MTENEVFEHIGDLAGDYKCFDEKISHQESLILCNLIEEVQQYRAIGTVEEVKSIVNIGKWGYRKGYAKAIDEFVKSEDYLMDKIKEETADVNIDFEWRKVVCLYDIRRMLHQGLCEIAEQLKAGGIDG